MIGTTVSHYRIVEKLGQGGMKEAYLAASAKIRLRQVRSSAVTAGKNPPHFLRAITVGA